MKSALVTAAAIVGLAASAVAQTPPAGPSAGQPGSPQPPAMAMPGAPGGGPHHPPPPHGPMGGMMEHHWMQHMMMSQSKAAHFYFKRGDSVMAVRCAEDEPMRACVDATVALLDKLNAQHAQH